MQMRSAGTLHTHDGANLPFSGAKLSPGGERCAYEGTQTLLMPVKSLHTRIHASTLLYISISAVLSANTDISFCIQLTVLMLLHDTEEYIYIFI